MSLEIRPMPREIEADLVDDLMGVGFPTIGHFLEEGFVNPSIRPMVTPVKVVGRAITVRITAPDSVLVHKATEMLQAGDVMVIDTGGAARHAPVGEMVALAAKCQGAQAIVIDGVCTDIVEIREMAMPVFARGTSVLTTKLHGLDSGGINVPISCGGVAVESGDIVLADDNGVLILKPEVAKSVLARAQASDNAEPATREYLRNGGSLPARTAANSILERLRDQAAK